MARPDPALVATSRLLENLILLMPDVRDHVRRELANTDSYPTTVPGASAPTATPTRKCRHCDGDGCDNCTTVEMTRVERAAHRREQITADMADVEAGIKLITVTVADVLDNARRLAGIRIERIAPKICTGGQGRENAIVWGSPTCTKVASRGDLCDACAQREYRDRKRRGLAPREDGVWSQPQTREAS